MADLNGSPRSTSGTSPTAQRSRPPDRLVLLDVLRGVAIFGTLATNVWIFSDPRAELRAQVAPLTDNPVETLFRFLANGKFLAMLTILFGVGLAIQFGSAQRRGRPWPRSYAWRPALLFIEGTIHFVLIYAYDVLMGYAVTALVVAWLVGRSERAQKRTMWWAAGIHIALMTLGTVALLLSPDDPAFTGVRQDLFTDGSYLDQVAFRLDHALVLRAEPIFTFGLLVFLFMLGVRLYRSGAFGLDERGRALRRRMLWIGFGVGLPLNITTTLLGPDFVLLDRYVAPALLTLGYIALVAAVLERASAQGRVTGWLTSVGRTALSCYVLQNLLCAVLCYGWGFGLGASLADARPWWVFGLWAGVSAAITLGAVLWLRRFPYGPLEWGQRWVLAHVPGGGPRSGEGR